MNEQELRKKLFEILGKTSSEWCGCYDGDMTRYVVLPRRNKAVDEICKLIAELHS